ncbi:MAG TPA: nitroreductase [Bacteroidales bacterium]|nr:nitroreductase [Bacteroidales bacterium]
MKSATTRYPVLDMIRERWSPRSFSPEMISEENLNTLLEAASWSFSGGNMQPWFYLYAHRGTSGFYKILDCLTPGNQSWARNASVLMVTLAKKERDPGRPNPWSKHDLGAANMNLILQALSMNIYGHLMGGFDAGKVIESLDVDPSVYEPVACIALGYKGDPGQLDESQREKELAPRTRKGIDEISREIL